MSENIVIIGGGQAGVQAAASLRLEGFAGAITLVGEEPVPPYQRPPLSKAYLEGSFEKNRLYLRAGEFYAKERIELRTGVRATAIDRKAKIVKLTDGEIAYDKLLIATGAPPRRIAAPGAGLAGVSYLRSIADSDALRPMLSSGKPLVVVGAGYIGLEVAAVARKAGQKVIVLEMAARALSRVAGPELSAFFENLHRDAGVDIRFGARVEGFTGQSCVEATISDGNAVECANVLVCIGAAPATTLAEECGLKVDNGILVDETAQTEDPAIWAAGDCTNHPSPLYGRRMRLESVPNAIDQAKAAAANMAGRRALYDAVPWFWSDQYDVKLQTAGIAAGADEAVVRGDPARKSFSVWSFAEGRLIAVDAVNEPAAFLVGKRLIAAKARPSPKTLADTAVDLKSLLS